MSSIRSRLDRLGKRGNSREDPDAPRRRMTVLLLHRRIANHRRAVEGEEQIPLTPEEEAFERENERRLINEGGLRKFREDPGWQDEESQAFLDYLERDNAGPQRG